MQDVTTGEFAGDVDANDNLESLIAASGGDTSLRYRVMENGKPVGELDMRELVKALVPRISSSVIWDTLSLNSLIKIHELYDNKNLYLTYTSDIWITFSFLIKKPNLKTQ